MSRAQGNKLYSNFSKGLITEASYLAFPEDASLDELNCNILEQGVRVRRRGFDKSWTITGGVLGTIPPRETYVWKTVAKEAAINFLVLLVNDTVRFHRITGPSALEVKTFSINLQTYKTGTADEISNNSCQFSSGLGELYICHPYMQPLRVVYNPTGDSITVSAIGFKVRDFLGVDDALAVDQEPATLTAEHNYNLRNQGWINPEATGVGTPISSYSIFGMRLDYSYPVSTGPIAQYYTAKGRYPGNNKIWWSSKDASGDFDPAALAKLFFGNTRAPRGHFILDPFNKDRSAVSGVSGLTAEITVSRPRAVEFSSGRVFWGHKNDLYFSPILEDGSRAGQCFQEADPTSEDISDLIATDGGVIPIPNADEIVRLVEFGSGVAVFATNGIWFVSEGSQGFSALEYSISKISAVGTNYPRSIVKADSELYWWSETGIHAMKQSVGQFGAIDGQFDQSNISDETIETFYNNIDIDKKVEAIGAYDPAQSKICWLYKQSVVSGKLDSMLLWYDRNLQAFYPWKVGGHIPVGAGFPSYSLGGLFVSPYFAVGTHEKTFLEFTGSIATGTSPFYGSSEIIGNFIDTRHVDWRTSVTAGVNSEIYTYESYLLTGYEMLGDGLRRKQAPIVGVFFKRTEDAVTDVGGGEYTIDNESSCFFQTRWDWANRDNGKWARSVQAYRPKAIPFIDADDPSANPGVDVVYSRNKVRGSGRSVQFRFYENRAGFGFELLGWHVFYQSKTVA